MHHLFAILLGLFATSLASQTYWFGDFSNYYEDGTAHNPNLDKEGSCCGYYQGDVDCGKGCDMEIPCGPKTDKSLGNTNRCGIAFVDDCGRSLTVGDGSGADCNWYAGDGNEAVRLRNSADGSDAGYCVIYNKKKTCLTWGSQIYGIALECYTNACGPVETNGPINTSFANGQLPPQTTTSSSYAPPPTSTPAWGNSTAPAMKMPRTLIPRLRPDHMRR